MKFTLKIDQVFVSVLVASTIPFILLANSYIASGLEERLARAENRPPLPQFPESSMEKS